MSKKLLKSIKENYENMDEKQRLEKLINEQTYELIKIYRNGNKNDKIVKDVKNEI